jgi:hypothetical protein
MSNTLISYKGENSYLNDDNTQNPVIYAGVQSYNRIYLNEDMSNTFNSCYLLNGDLQDIYNKFNWTYVKDMSYTFNQCRNITGSPVCSENVTNMCGTYYNCQNITGNAVCGSNVIDMDYTYYNCRNLTGNPVCGPNVTDMNYTYFQCYNLTGNITIPESVNSLDNTFCLPAGNMMAIDVTLPSKWQGSSQVNTWINCVNSVTYY